MSLELCPTIVPEVPSVGDYRVKLLSSTDELRRMAAAWDDLWRRSEVDVPSARANLVALWVDHFQPRAALRAVIIEHEGRLVAALPLVIRRLRGVVTVASLPCNDWAASGDLLVDPAADVATVLDLLAQAISDIDARLLWLEQVAIESPRWQALLAACRRIEMLVSVREHYRVGQVEINQDWDAYEATRKGDHRRSRRRYAKLLDQAGGAELRVACPNPAGVKELLLRGFEVENRSWKGAAGSSVLKTPGLFDFLILEARQLATWNQLELCFLEHRGQAIAFDYGWNSKGVHFVPKLGYDDAFSKFGPGQQLLMRILERLHNDPERRLLDFWGPLVSWNESWSTRSYGVGRVVMAAPQAISRGLFRAYADWHPRLRRFGQTLRAAATRE